MPHINRVRIGDHKTLIVNFRVSLGRNAYLVFALLARIKLGALVDVIAGCIAADAHRKHHPHLDVLICGLLPAWDLHKVEVWGVILVQNLPFSYLITSLIWTPIFECFVVICGMRINTKQSCAHKLFLTLGPRKEVIRDQTCVFRLFCPSYFGYSFN